MNKKFFLGIFVTVELAVLFASLISMDLKKFDQRKIEFLLILYFRKV